MKPWNTSLLPFRIRNMIAKNPAGFDEFGPRYWTGIVANKSNAKTAAVAVHLRTPHPVYKKPVLKTKTYLVHDELDECGVGDRILFEKSRPFSKRKHWIIRVILRRDVGAEYLHAHPEIAERSGRRSRKEQEALEKSTTEALQ